MHSNHTNEDLRSIKTKKALCAAMFTLLKNVSFRKITIREICQEASISRATFYAHFLDKYDLLRHWAPELWPKEMGRFDSYEQAESAVNLHISENKTVLHNLVSDADDETFDVLFDFILSTIDLSIDKYGGKEPCAKDVVLSNFYAGGIISYLTWQVRNKFPAAVPTMNRSLHKMLRELRDWRLQ